MVRNRNRKAKTRFIHSVSPLQAHESSAIPPSLVLGKGASLVKVAVDAQTAEALERKLQLEREEADERLAAGGHDDVGQSHLDSLEQVSHAREVYMCVHHLFHAVPLLHVGAVSITLDTDHGRESSWLLRTNKVVNLTTSMLKGSPVFKTHSQSFIY